MMTMNLTLHSPGNICIYISNALSSHSQCICTAKKRHVTLGNPTATDPQGFLVDIAIQDAADQGPMHEEKQHDVDQFLDINYTK